MRVETDNAVFEWLPYIQLGDFGELSWHDKLTDQRGTARGVLRPRHDTGGLEKRGEYYLRKALAR